MSGFDLAAARARWIREVARLRVATADNQPRVVLEALRLGADMARTDYERVRDSHQKGPMN